MAITKPVGTKDMLPEEATFWMAFQETAADVFGRYGYQPIVTPVLEKHELFVRGIGEATDVVSKEMFQALSDENLNILASGGELLFCAHHGKAHQDKLQQVALKIQDETGRIS